MKTLPKLLVIILSILQLFVIISCEKENNDEEITENLVDIHGNIYSTIKIGEQTWMAENLRTLTGIGTVAYDNDNITLMPTYGFLYNWQSANEACPDGWHLPSVDDWNELINYLGGEDIAGGKLKETGTLHWNSPNEGASNESEFTCLPGGFYNSTTGHFQLLTQNAIFWTSTPIDTITASLFTLNYANSTVTSTLNHKESKLSVRCLKD